ncbi:MAG TPA: DoxX family protein [Candidatus Angelobacter sp.]
MRFSNTGTSSVWMGVARIAVGVMFLFFAQYKLLHKDFAHGGFESWVKPWAETNSLHFYRPVLQFTLKHPVFFGYATGVVELLIGLSMLIGWWVRTFSIIGVLYMLNLTFATWYSPPAGSAYWKYLGAELDHIPLLLLFIIFAAHKAGETLGLE